MDGFTWVPNVAVQLAVGAVLWFRVVAAERDLREIAKDVKGMIGQLARLETEQDNFTNTVARLEARSTRKD